VTDLSAPLPVFFAQTFITGVDIHIPARGLTTVVSRQRGTNGLPDTLVIPAWPSTRHRSTLTFDDHI